MYSIIDIETTGGAGRHDKITEIAIFVHDGEKVIDQFVSLINPECSISPQITTITGITNEMVAHSPKFFEVAKRIVEITEGTIFVAHSVNFDYSFIKNEFKRLGYNYNRKRLCTVKLGRKFLPGHASYSLGNICEDLDISIHGRHRAEGDAAATVKLFDIILEKCGDNLLTDSKQWVTNLPNDLDRKIVESLPEEKGVYYFYNKEKALVYVGKSNNIYSRILSHLGNLKSNKAMRMREDIADISYETTGSELVALLLESDEIKAHQPHYNVSQRRTSFLWGINALYDFNGYLNLEIVKNKKEQKSQLSFSNKAEVTNYIEQLVNEHRLCPKLCGIYKAEKTCFNHMIGKCDGACVGKEEVDEYNARVQHVLKGFKYKDDNFVLIDEGRSETEKSLVVIQEGRYVGYGYIEDDCSISTIEEAVNYIFPKEENKDIRKIITSYMDKNKGLKVLRF